MFLSCRGGVCPPEYINVCIVGTFGQANPAPTFNCRDSVSTLWGSFPASGIRAHAVGKLSSLGNPRPRRGEAFQPWESALTPWRSFPALGIRAHAVGKLSSLGNPRPRRGEAFQLWDSVPTLWGSFRDLHFRKVSIIGGFANISAEKIGFRKRIFCFAVGLSGKNKSAGAGNRAAADS